MSVLGNNEIAMGNNARTNRKWINGYSMGTFCISTK